MKDYERWNLNLELTRVLDSIIPEEKLIIKLHPVHFCTTPGKEKKCEACAGAVYLKEREPEFRHILLALSALGKLIKEQEFSSDDDGDPYMSLFCEDGLGGSGPWYDLSRSVYGQTAEVKRELLKLFDTTSLI